MNVTIITNSLKFLMESTNYDDTAWNLFCLGGTFSPRTYSSVNTLTVDNLSYFRISKTFFSTYGIDEECIITDSHIEDIEIKRAALHAAKCTYLLADHSKMMRSGILSCGNASDCTEIITDYKANSAFVHKLREHSCNVTIAASIVD